MPYDMNLQAEAVCLQREWHKAVEAAGYTLAQAQHAMAAVLSGRAPLALCRAYRESAVAWKRYYASNTTA